MPKNLIFHGQQNGPTTFDEVLFGSQMIVMYMVLDPPGMVARKQFGQGRDGEQPAIGRLVAKDQ